MFAVAVAGSLHLDIVIYGSPLPAPDETVFGERWSFKCGGKGGNQAKSAARFGAKTKFIGRVGKDDFGRRLVDDLRQFNVDVSGVSEDEAHGSGMSAAIIDHQGNYGASVVSGANQYVAPGQGLRIGAGVLLLQNEIPEAANIAVARAARREGATVILNCAPWRTPDPALVLLIDLFILNRVEAEQSGGVLDKASHRLIVTRGAEGVDVVDRGVATHISPHSIQQISSHGAGDTFCGALAARLSAGDDLVTAARFANAAAALFVSRSTEAPITAADVLRLLRR